MGTRGLLGKLSIRDAAAIWGLSSWAEAAEAHRYHQDIATRCARARDNSLQRLVRQTILAIGRLVGTNATVSNLRRARSATPYQLGL